MALQLWSILFLGRAIDKKIKLGPNSNSYIAEK